MQRPDDTCQTICARALVLAQLPASNLDALRSNVLHLPISRPAQQQVMQFVEARLLPQVEHWRLSHVLYSTCHVERDDEAEQRAAELYEKTVAQFDDFVWRRDGTINMRQTALNFVTFLGCDALPTSV